VDEARVLSLVARYPHPAALARHARDGAVFSLLRRLEASGYVTRRRGLYRLTRRGRDELWAARAIARLLARWVA
jgi:DNA-binding PadR family transcriptional regulator